MHTSLLLPIVALVGAIIYKAFQIIVNRQKDAAFARQHNCLPAPAVTWDGFLGIKIIKQMKAADQKNMFMNLLDDRVAEMSNAVGRFCPTFSYRVLGKQGFFTCDPKNIQAILAHQFQDFELGALRRRVMGEPLGDGIFVQDGKKWEHSRALLRPNFVREQVADLDMEERHVQDLFTVMPVRDDGWTDTTNIQELFFRLTIDTATEFLFGESTNTQVTTLAKSQTNSTGRWDERAFAKHFDSVQRHMSSKFRFGDLHWLHNPKEYQDDIKIINEFISYFVDLALTKRSEKTHAKGEKYVFLEALAAQTQDPVALRAQLLNILLAGRDTTASLLSWTFHELLRHPEVFEKLRNAIISDFGPYSTDDISAITFSSLKSCTYLQHTLSEALRLWPVVPGNSRRSNKRTTLPRGGGPDGLSPVFIPPETQVDYSVYVMMRRKDLWGEDANEFRPERFEGRKPGWDYLPFNGGARLCIGQQLALTEAAYVVARILQKFDKIEANPEDLETGVITQNLTLTSCPARQVKLRAREAKA